MDGRSASVFERGQLCCHCLLLEDSHGLTLVDTGFGLRDVASPRARLSSFFLHLLAPDFREEMTAVRQIERMGFSARDVRNIVLTHLDFDHAGGLDDFPEATVHLMRSERDEASRQKTWLDRQRFRPQQWSGQGRWQTYKESAGEPWYGFSSVRELRGLPPEILMVPLLGHTLGHAGIAVDTGSGGWLLMAGDAYFYRDEMDEYDPYCTPGLRLYQTLMEKDRRARLMNQRRLRRLKADFGKVVRIVSAHDPVEFEMAARRSAAVPAQPADGMHSAMDAIASARAR
jgi:glyoxylase-like metal-dependent hydrolase (beta-lactamase superfamily II)